MFKNVRPPRNRNNSNNSNNNTRYRNRRPNTVYAYVPIKLPVAVVTAEVMSVFAGGGQYKNGGRPSVFF